ncbi:uncharacterized protein [Lolium perenne]|uniref:uncharacterized protein isoform X5 n=1 Tax=Lolium perenne TaxID=4522 RepID=UPI003A98DF9E
MPRRCGSGDSTGLRVCGRWCDGGQEEELQRCEWSRYGSNMHIREKEGAHETRCNVKIAWLLVTICSDTSFQLATYHELLLHKDLQMDFACSSSVSRLWSVKTYLGDYQLKEFMNFSPH